MIGDRISKSRWQRAFPLAKFAPVLEPLEETPQFSPSKLAKQFCPHLWVDPDIMRKERKFLFDTINKGGKNLDKVTEALFLYELGRFPKVTTAAKLRLLGPALWIKKVSGKIPENGILGMHLGNVERAMLIEEVQFALREEIEWNDLKEEVLDLFNEILKYDTNDPSPTCVVKYHIVRHPLDPDIYCIMYFTYWPIQLFPPHIFDYEPFYVFVRRKSRNKFEPLLMTFNADPGTYYKRAKPLRRRKKMGHIILTYFNWNIDTLQITPYHYNPMAEYMTNAFGRQYLYKEVPSKELEEMKALTHINRLRSPSGHPIGLLISNKWHAYQPISNQIPKNYQLVKSEPVPLKTQDLFHIEWDIRNPFQAPYLYPTVGGKNPLMHLPLDLVMLYEHTSFSKWMDVAIHAWEDVTWRKTKHAWWDFASRMRKRRMRPQYILILLERMRDRYFMPIKDLGKGTLEELEPVKEEEKVTSYWDSQEYKINILLDLLRDIHKNRIMALAKKIQKKVRTKLRNLHKLVSNDLNFMTL